VFINNFALVGLLIDFPLEESHLVDGEFLNSIEFLNEVAFYFLQSILVFMAEATFRWNFADIVVVFHYLVVGDN
jgi:hypothetical protein